MDFMCRYVCRASHRVALPRPCCNSWLVLSLMLGFCRLRSRWRQLRGVSRLVMKYHPWFGIISPSSSNLTLTREQVGADLRIPWTLRRPAPHRYRMAYYVSKSLVLATGCDRGAGLTSFSYRARTLDIVDSEYLDAVILESVYLLWRRELHTKARRIHSHVDAQWQWLSWTALPRLEVAWNKPQQILTRLFLDVGLRSMSR